MYKPVPQVLPNDEDSENEWVSTLHFDQKSPEHDGGPFTTGQDVSETWPHQDAALPPRLSTARKVAVFFSIVNCLAFVVVFLWVLPCDCDTCHSPQKIFDLEWEIQLNEKGVQLMDIAIAKSKTQEYLVIANKKMQSPTFNMSRITSDITNNLMGINLVNGGKTWEKNMSAELRYLNCHLIDVNNDGVYDCLLFSTVQGLLAIDSKTGIVQWHWHSHQDQEKPSATTQYDLVDLDSALDLNHDAVAELVAIVTDSKTSFLIAISGRSGELLWQQVLNASCTRLNHHSLIGDVAVDPLCLQQSESFPNNRSLYNSIQLVADHEKTPAFEILSKGDCPDCEATLTLLDPVDRMTLLWNMSFPRSRIFQPIDCIVKGSFHWKIAFEIQHFIDHNDALSPSSEHHIDVIEIDKSAAGTARKLAHIPTGLLDTRYILHAGLKDSLVLIALNYSVPNSVLKKTHL